MIRTASELINRITFSPSRADIGNLSNDLLKQFYRGHPLSDLRPLLRSQDDEVVAIAVWIASEVGERCQPLFDDIVPLLNHPFQRVRFWALDCLVWAPLELPCALAKGVALLDDSAVGIRRKVLDLLTRLPDSRLRPILSDTNVCELGTPVVEGLQWLLSPASKQLAAVASALQSPDMFMRKFAVVAAARVGSEALGLLVCVGDGSDDDITVFAQRRLQH